MIVSSYFNKKLKVVKTFAQMALIKALTKGWLNCFLLKRFH
ncbi:hypothetical protein HMPREF3209_00066 [Lactobacillus crispatus]|nr:hypothetical protein HMPREF3209_00066 [Lactobacillus crispatus]